MSTDFKVNLTGSGDPGIRMNPVGVRRTEGTAFAKDLNGTKAVGDTKAKASDLKNTSSLPTELKSGGATELLEAMSTMVKAITDLLKLAQQDADSSSATQPSTAASKPKRSGRSGRSKRKPARSADSTAMHGGSSCGGSSSCSGCSTSGSSKPSRLRSTGGAGSASASNDPAANQRLQESLDLIRQDPEGSRLLAEAERRGVRISPGNPGGSNILGVFNPNNNSIIVRDPSNIKTIIHELVHATTPEDGNSRTEEGLANVVGDRVASRIQGRTPGNPSAIFNNTLGLYPELRGRNGIRSSLAGMGIQTPEFVA